MIKPNFHLKSAVPFLGFKRVDKIRHAGAIAEDYFAESFGKANVQYMNIPRGMAAPNAPLFILANSNMQLVVSQVHAQISLEFSPSQVSENTAWGVIRKYSELLFGFAQKALPPDTLQTAATVFTFNCPTNEPDEVMADYLFQQLLKVPVTRPIVNCQVVLGYQTESELFVNSTWNAYQIKEIEIQGQVSDAIDVAEHQGRITERGLALTLDVNNKPRVRAGQKFDATIFDEIQAAAKAAYSNKYLS